MSSLTGRGREGFPASIRGGLWVSRICSFWAKCVSICGGFEFLESTVALEKTKHLGVVTVVQVDWYLISPAKAHIHPYLSWFISQSTEVQHHFETAGKDRQPEERPSPVGAGGSRGDPYRNMCQRADDVPSYKSLPGSVGDRIRTTMSFRTICRGGSMSANPGFGRSDRKVARCEKCSATLVALKKQALSLAVHHHFSCKVSDNDTVMGIKWHAQPCAFAAVYIITVIISCLDSTDNM